MVVVLWLLVWALGSSLVASMWRGARSTAATESAAQPPYHARRSHLVYWYLAMAGTTVPRVTINSVFIS